MITYVDPLTSARLPCGLLLLLPVHDCEEPLSTVSGAAATVLCGGSRTKSSPAVFFSADINRGVRRLLGAVNTDVAFSIRLPE